MALSMRKGQSLVKAADLGYKSNNLQDLPSKEEKKRNQYEVAIANLASTAPPDRLHPPLPSSLFNGSKEQ